ncbi:MAG: hypothetical protein JSW52_11980 [Candidatus Coatesbacteria bacterium]|nr:MAG: hypothetical protein JSW52_11980 [Candidatus Coatesbacteria bacterium]
MKLRLALVGLAVAAALIVAGCINYDQTMALNADGSGMVTIHYTSDDPEGTQAPKLSFSEEEITAEYADSDVTVSDIAVVVPAEGEEGSHEATYVLAFDDVTDLNGYGIFAVGDQMTQVFALADAGDTAVFTQTCTLTMDVEDTSGLTDYKFTYSLACPGAVTDTNGIVGADGYTVTWEYPLPDLINNTVEMNATYEKPAEGVPGAGGLLAGGIVTILGIIICVIIIVVIIIIIIVLLKKKGKKSGPAPPPAE